MESPSLVRVQWVSKEELKEIGYTNRPLSLAETTQARIDTEGVKYTSSVWQLLQAKGKFLTAEEAEAYALVQKAHFEFTGYSLPPIKGAKMTKAQIRDAEGPAIKEEVLEKAIQGGLAAKLRQMRGE